MDSDLQSAKLDSLQTLVRRDPPLPSAHSWPVPAVAPLLCLTAQDSPLQSPVHIFLSHSVPALCPTGPDFSLILSPGSLLQTACCAIYGQKELQEFLPSLWSSLRREVSAAGPLTKAVLGGPISPPSPHQWPRTAQLKNRDGGAGHPLGLAGRVV